MRKWVENGIVKTTRAVASIGMEIQIYKWSLRKWEWIFGLDQASLCKMGRNSSPVATPSLSFPDGMIHAIKPMHWCVIYYLNSAMSGIYDDLCNLFIKPARQNYSEHDLGPLALGAHGVRQNFTLLSQQGHDIKASFFRSRNKVTDTCVLYLHSFNGSRLESLKYAGEVLQAGFHFCSFDFPGCGNSGGEYVTLGCNERWDVLRLIEQVRLRFGVGNFFVWGRSMGAVAAIKFYQLLAQEQSAGRCQDIVVLGLVLDSAFISLKRMVVEVAQTRVSIPGLLVKAVFMMVSSSIEERAGFKVQQLELGADVEAIRCSTLLVTSKEDSFVNYSHSEEIFSKLKLHDSKEIEYTRGQHYQSRDPKTLSSIYSFFEKKHKKFNGALQKMGLANSRIHPQHFHELSLDKHTKSLRKYQPKQATHAPPEHLKFIYESQKKLLPASTKIVLFRSMAQEKEKTKCMPSGQFHTCSDKKIPLRAQAGERQYLTQKKIEDPHIRLVTASKQEKHKNGLRNKSKPNFVCRIEEICSSHRFEDDIERDLSKSTGRTLEQAENQENHCNIITDKLRKKPKNQRERIIEFKDRNDGEEHLFKTIQSQQLKLFDSQLRPEVTKIRPKVNFTIGQPSTPTVTQKDHDPSAKKLSMTAQQYKNNQIKIIKGVVMLSPNIKRRADKASCSDLKAKVAPEELRSSEQSKSMNCLITLGGDGNSRNMASVITVGSGNRKE